jgi:hypothetical protein
MATVTRTTTWSDNQVLTASALNAEFDNLLDAVAIVNADVSASAAIAYSKLALTGSIKNADIASDAAIASSKISLSVNRGFAWYLDGTSIVANEVGAKYIVPQNMTVVSIKTKTVSGTATVRIQKDTDDVDAGISVTSTVASETSITSAALTANQVLTLDITAASSCVGLTVTVECSQP